MRYFYILCGLFLISCNSSSNENPHAIIETDYGKIEIELYPAKAPKTVAAFISFIEKGNYNNSSFYRVLKAEELPTDNNSGLIQGGIHMTNQNKIKVDGIPHEPTSISGLTHTDGVLSLARTDPGTATTEFFICIGDQSSLDQGRKGTPDGLGMAAFGKVHKGMQVVRLIQSQESNGDLFIKKVGIKQIKMQ